MTGRLTPKERTELNLQKRALEHWTKTCADQCDTCEGCPYNDNKTPCVQIQHRLHQLTLAYKEVILKPPTSL